MNIQGNGTQRTDNFSVTLDQFVRQYAGARRGLWMADGRVVELGAAIEYDFAARKILIGRVEQLEGVKGSRNFKPQEMDPEQLLLLLAWGPGEEAKAHRSQHLKAIRKFKETGLERTEAAYVAWVEGEGGFRKAGKGASNLVAEGANNAGDDSGESVAQSEASPAQGTNIANEELISNVVKLWKRSRDLPVVSGDLPHEAFAQSSATLMLVIKGPEIHGVPQTRLVPIAADEAWVEREALKAAQALSSSFREASLIYRLNMLALAFARAPYFPGEITSNAVIKFMRDIKMLKSKQAWCEKYGLADTVLPSIAYCNDARQNNGTVEVFNKDFHEWDPGRFIKGAKPGMLVPYSLKGSKLQISDAAKAYADDFIAWKARWAKLNTVTSIPYQSSFTNVSTGPSENVGQITNDVIDAGQDGAPKNGEAGAASDDLQPVAASEAIAHGETEIVVEDNADGSNEPEGQHAEDGDVPAEYNAGQNAVQAFDMRQPQPEMAD